MKNKFENAYFGKAYKTRDDRKVIYVKHSRYDAGGVCVVYEDIASIHRVMNDGHYWSNCIETDDDIVSEWHEPIVCKCQWKDYYDYRIMLPNGEGHVRVSFFDAETIISDLYVAEEHRHKGYASVLLDKVDELLAGKKAIIYPIEEWQNKWYKQRGYIIGKEDSIDEEKLDDKSLIAAIEYNKELGNTMTIDQECWYQEGYYDGYRQGWEDKQ